MKETPSKTKRTNTKAAEYNLFEIIRNYTMVTFCAAFPLKCPEPAQWALRANGHCTDPSKYFCLKNDLINGYSENCTRSDFQQPGRKAVLRGGIDADECSEERFQPFPLKFYTNVSTHCLFLKSLCNEEGQVVYENGNRNTDTTCRCDYRRGYDFLVKPNNPCFCKPSHEDCSCYLKTCSNSSYILSTDYDCIHKTDLSLVTQYRTITDENVISGRRLDITESVPLEDNISFLVIREPQPEIRLIEGAPLNLQYNIPTKRFRLRFFKDRKYIGESLNARQNVFRKKKVTLEDQGVYYAKLYFIKSSITHVNVDSMFTSEFNPLYCIEGETLCLKCSVYSEDIDVEWFKKNPEMFKKEKINENENISIDTDGKDHAIIIKNAKLTDSGYYIIIAGNVQKQLKVTVKAFFKRPLEDTKIMEGIDVSFECEAEKPYSVEWFKDNNRISLSSKFKISKLDNNVHKLTILKTELEDKGKYRIQIKDKSTVSTAADLDVKGNSILQFLVL
ncbi:TTN [Mytilus coruscus]|uniref:TTN n=1 Tax=Mytilus coruscus TaxID=42192 RepID=A0A6J8B5F2_MYTCO|nr:TTN [Mytilus coruscus]